MLSKESDTSRVNYLSNCKLSHSVNYLSIRKLAVRYSSLQLINLLNLPIMTFWTELSAHKWDQRIRIMILDGQAKFAVFPKCPNLAQHAAVVCKIIPPPLYWYSTTITSHMAMVMVICQPCGSTKSSWAM